MKPKKQWDHKWYTEEFLQQLKATAAVEMDGDLPYITKYAPDAGSPNGIDPRLLGGPMGKMARSTGLVPNFILDRVKIPVTPKILAGFRAGCDRVSYAKCVQAKIEVRDSTVPAADGYPIPIRMYNSAQCTPGSPCLYFIHGGAFVGGTLRPYDEGWKLFVEKFRMPVVAVDYRLLPEHPYPTLYDDCCRVLEWLGGDGARELHIDPRAVFVVGDSAGGNPGPRLRHPLQRYPPGAGAAAALPHPKPVWQHRPLLSPKRNRLPPGAGTAKAGYGTGAANGAALSLRQVLFRYSEAG